MSFPPFCLIRRVLRKVQIDMATLTLINPAYSSLAKLNLVPKSPLNEHKKSNFNSQNKQPFVESILPRMSSCDKQNNTASDVGSCIGKLVVEGLSKQAFSYYSESRRKGSINHYKSAGRKLNSWYCEGAFHPIRCRRKLCVRISD